METKEYKKGKLSCQLWSGETGLPLLVVLDEPAVQSSTGDIHLLKNFRRNTPALCCGYKVRKT